MHLWEAFNSEVLSKLRTCYTQPLAAVLYNRNKRSIVVGKTHMFISFEIVILITKSLPVVLPAQCLGLFLNPDPECIVTVLISSY